MSMLLDDELGPPVETDRTQALTFIQRWHGSLGGRAGRVALVGIEHKADGGRGRSRFLVLANTLAKTRDAIKGAGLEPLVAREGTVWNLYHNVLLVKEQPPPRKRGGKSNTLMAPGLCADLDVKPGSFDSQEECLDLLRGLALWPSLIVLSGSGGVQPYWLVEGGATPEEYERLMHMLWVWLTKESGRKIDRTISSDRIMRLPGSIRWPKDAVRTVNQVKLHYSDGRALSRHEIETACAPALHEWDARYSRVARDYTRQENHAEGLLREIYRRRRQGPPPSGQVDWEALVSLSEFEDLFNRRYTWDDVLLGKGWTLEPGSEGGERRYWRWPGKTEGHQATTDCLVPGRSPHIMTLFSDAVETGLQRLYYAEIRLTKLRVFAELWFEGDISKAVMAARERIFND